MKNEVIIVFFVLLVLSTMPIYAQSNPHTITNSIGCLDCHAMHTSNIIPRGEVQENLCKSCHCPGGQAATMDKVKNHVVNGGATIVDCGSCHAPHSQQMTTDPHTGNTAINLKLIRGNTKKYVPQALEPAIFQNRTTDFAFNAGNSPWNGICQTCHKATSHHTNDGAGDHVHQMGLACTACHPHKEGFMPVGGCFDCHNTSQGGRRQIVESGGDFAMTSHHVSGTIQESDCSVCHYLGNHGSGTVKLKDPDSDSIVYSYSLANPAGIENFCVNCHDDNGVSRNFGGGTQPFSDGKTVPNLKNAWQISAHKLRGYSQNSGQPITCFGNGQTSGCHGNGHGSNNIKILAGSSFGSNLHDMCFRCHTDGKISNNSISGDSLANDIQQAFAMGNKHDMGGSFSIGGTNFTLQCTTCHNPHVATGKYWDASSDVTPITSPDFTDPTDNPRAMGTTVWGALASQKMNNYAGSGTYQTPSADIFAGDKLPDYVTFCQGCHASGKMPNPPTGRGGINWGEVHGLSSANVPNGGSSVPNWFACGKAKGWDGDDATGDCWPALPRGRGEQIFSRDPYSQEERIAGANFVLSCTDCHEAHGSNVSSMLRSNPNGGSGTVIWNTMCNNCHYYYSDWHAGMSCGNASCHVSQRMNDTGTNTLHSMSNGSGSGATRSFDRDLVLDMRFENNLKDSGTWRMHGAWRVTAGTYAAGKFGQAIDVSDDPVEVGTENGYWSTDDGYHGTWKYTEMKYHMTLEAWVYPTDGNASERKIFAKHTYTDGGYALVLKKMGNNYRAALMVSVNGGGTYGVWDADSNGLRGAYSSVPIPLNKWTHIGATFDTDGPDRNAGDLSVGRVRIYVNGEDVTTSYPSNTQTFCQPGPGETAIFPYSDHSNPGDSSPDNPYYKQNPWGYEGHWCASALSIGGMNWSSTGDTFIGRLDEVKIWNITKDAIYFEAVDAISSPRIAKVEGMVGRNDVTVVFSEGVYTNSNGTGNLQPADFALTDADNGRTIVSVTHTAGSATATLILSSALDSNNDINVDTIAAVNNAIYDEYGNAAETDAVAITMLSQSPVGTVTFELNEPANNIYVLDTQQVVYGTVNDPTQTLLGNGCFNGDGVNNYIEFTNNQPDLKATTAMTLEARLKPSTVDTGGNSTVQRIFAANNSFNYQMSVWRNTDPAAPATYPWGDYYQAPSNVASIAFWVRAADPHGGDNWKVALTDYTQWPIVANHWYLVKAVWNSSKPTGIPADIYVDDQGTDGNGAGELWAGYVNCTDTDQNQTRPPSRMFQSDIIVSGDGNFTIGVNPNTYANPFNGLIDWVIWKPSAN
jgi:hypothetical protein